MASYQNYQRNEKKYENSNNIYIKKAKQGKKDQKSKDFWNNFKKYVSYYRENPHRFCIEYLGIYLHWWQQIVLYAMWFTGNIIFLASRGSGKSYLTMVYCVAKAMLYPGTIIRVASANKKQAGMLLAKIKEIQRNCPMVKREIKDISIGKDESRIIFHGGSEVATVVAGDGARGERCNILIVDEREIVNKEIIDKVFIPFLTATRKPPYLKESKYKYLEKKETNHFIELSSIGSKTSSLYKEFEDYLSFMKKGLTDDYAVFSIPYQIPLSSGVIDIKLIKKMIRENTSSTESFRQEMEVIPSGDNESSMFKFDDLNKNRKINMPLIPITDDEYFNCNGNIKKYSYYQKKEIDELRIISMDVATMGGRENDLTVFCIFRLTLNGDEYIKELVYIETMDGTNIDPQALRFKQLFYDLECDYAVLDGGGIGQTIYDLCTKKTDDEIRGKKYPAWKAINDVEKYNIRILDEGAVPVLYVVKISGASATIEHAKLIGMARLNFEKKKVKLLLSEDVAIDRLSRRFKLIKTNIELKKRLLTPFMHTSSLIKEGVNTIVKKHKGGITIDEKNGLKDRLMSMLYGLYFINMLEQDLQESLLNNDDPNDPLVYF